MSKKRKKKSASKKAAPKNTVKAKASGRGKRYTAAQKAKVLKYVDDINASKGRGGAAAASRKFGISQITIGQWIKSGGATKPSGKKRGRPAVAKKGSSKKTAATGGGFSAKLRRLATLHDSIKKKEAELASMHSELDKLKKSL